MSGRVVAGIGLALVAAVAMLAGADRARAATDDYVCDGEGYEFEVFIAGKLGVKVCQPMIDIAPLAIWTVPSRSELIHCPEDHVLFGTPSVRPADFRRWNFWQRSGGWVTGTGLSQAEGFRLNGVQHWTGFQPVLANWWIGSSWPVRVRFYCERVQDARGDAVDDADTDAETLTPGKGDEVDLAGPGDDEMHGGEGDDFAHGDGGRDELFGGDGKDQLLGGRGRDEAYGRRGDDQLFDDQGRDYFNGGPGDDRFSAHDDKPDVIDCGAGDDVVVSDRADDVSASCEHVYENRAEAPRRPPVQH